MNYLRDELIKRSITEATEALSLLRLNCGSEHVVYYNCQKSMHITKFRRTKKSIEQQRKRDMYILAHSAALSRVRGGSKQEKKAQQFLYVVSDKEPNVKVLGLFDSGCFSHDVFDGN